MLPQIIANTSNCILIVAPLRRQPIFSQRGNVPGLRWLLPARRIDGVNAVIMGICRHSNQI
jgi:hypothetical protein